VSDDIPSQSAFSTELHLIHCVCFGSHCAIMASSSFRDSMNGLGWSRRDQPVTTNTTKPLLGGLSRWNPFGGEGGLSLPTTEGEGPGAPLPAPSRREEEEGWFACKF
jgi:hypothetical protein